MRLFFLSLLLFICSHSVEADTAPVCAEQVWVHGQVRIKIAPEWGTKMKAALKAAGISVSEAGRRIELAGPVLARALRGESSFSPDDYHALVELLPEGQRSSYAPTVVGLPLWTDSQSEDLPTRVVWHPAFRRLFRSYRLALQTKPRTPLQEEVWSQSVCYSLSVGRMLSTPRERFFEFVDAFEIPRSTALGLLDPTLRCRPSEENELCKRWVTSLTWSKFSYVIYQDESKLEADLLTLACVANPDEDNVQSEWAVQQIADLARGWLIRALQFEPGALTAEQMKLLEAVTQRFIRELPESDLTLPVSAHLARLLALETAPPPEVLRVEVKRDERVDPPSETSPPRTDWQERFDALPSEALEAIARQLPPTVLPSKAFIKLWDERRQEQGLTYEWQERLVGVSKRKTLYARKHGSVEFAPTELVNLIALLDLPMGASLRLAMKPDWSEPRGRVTITHSFRAVAVAHAKTLSLTQQRLDLLAGNGRNYAQRILKGEYESSETAPLERLITQLKIDRFTANALLGAPLICDPKLEPERCELTYETHGTNYVPVITYFRLEDAVEDLIKLSFSLSEAVGEARPPLETALKMRLRPILSSRLKPLLQSPREKRFDVAIEPLVELASGELGKPPCLFLERVGQRLSEWIGRAAEEANEIPAKRFEPKRFQYD